MEFICFILTFSFSCVVVSGQCPSGWSHHDDSCYHYSHDTETWADAAVICKLDDAHLVEIEDMRENNFVHGLVGKGTWAWIGGNDLNVEGEWIWAASKTDLQFTNFLPNQPDNAGLNENCLDMTDTGKWNDAPCHIFSQYVCEQPIEESSSIVG